MHIYWEDRVSKAQYAAIERAVETFRKIRRRSRQDEDALYADLTNNGMTSEEADEYVNLLIEGA
jgi:hypothetical protein